MVQLDGQSAAVAASQALHEVLPAGCLVAGRPCRWQRLQTASKELQLDCAAVQQHGMAHSVTCCVCLATHAGQLLLAAGDVAAVTRVCRWCRSRVCSPACVSGKALGAEAAIGLTWEPGPGSAKGLCFCPEGQDLLASGPCRRQLSPRALCTACRIAPHIPLLEVLHDQGSPEQLFARSAAGGGALLQPKADLRLMATSL